MCACMSSMPRQVPSVRSPKIVGNDDRAVVTGKIPLMRIGASGERRPAATTYTSNTFFANWWSA